MFMAVAVRQQSSMFQRRNQSTMFQRRNRLYSPERSLLRLLLAAVVITTVLFRFSNAGGLHTDDRIYTRKLSDIAAQRIEVYGHAANSGRNDNRDCLDPSKHEPLLYSSKATRLCNKHKKKRSLGYATEQVSPEMKEFGPCETGWTFKGNSCYKLTSQELTWSQAQAECRSMRSLLAEIENSHEQDAVHKFLTSQGSEWAWIGLSKQTSDGSWVWSSGRPMTYSNWLRTKHENEPNNFGGSENCVNVWPKRNSTWNDYVCTINMTGLCQKGHCGDGWTSTRKSCYQLTDALPRSSARDTCRSKNGYLAEVKNANEHDELYDFLKTEGPNTYYWIGLSDPHNNRSWQWDSGSNLTYTNWFTGEPNNLGRSEYCVAIWSSRDFGWNDEPCTEKNRGVCAQNRPPSGKSADTTSKRPSFTISTSATTPRSGSAVTTTKVTDCDVESPVCRTLSERGFCSQGIHRHYMVIACRRSCDRCPLKNACAVICSGISNVLKMSATLFLILFVIARLTHRQ